MSDLTPEAWVANEAKAIAQFAVLNWGDIDEQKRHLCYELAKAKLTNQHLMADLDEARKSR